MWLMMKYKCIATLKEHEAHDWEEVDQDNREDESEDNGSDIPGHWSDYIAKSFLSRDEVN